ncbi:MAG: MgtC/SapB family protein [Alphaproteobacteria bacterium]|nr:MgtC/SapB family protein [Alphaproteobacteria bacterium]MBU2380767.1 MgtC/SapB family protein [Alphaproteobacteria bacterium]
MDFSDLPGFAAPLFAALVAGAVIGLEREWRGRAAGFRTHILVCLASALLMEAAVSQGAWRFQPLAGTEIVSDPTRMAHGVLTGIGFLCAGVIFRSGFSIHGLTTAASLWITATIGMLFGVGLFALGAAGTVLTFAILMVLRLVSRRLPALTVSDLEVTWRRDIDARDAVEAAIRDVDPERSLDRLELTPDGDVFRRSYRIRTTGEDALIRLGDALTAMPAVTGWRIDPRDD